MNLYLFRFNSFLKLNSFIFLNLFFFYFFFNNISILILDSFLLDDEPFWEPLEWSVVQNWLLFIYLFSWISETLITSKYGSFTGRDKRVYTGLFKTFWFVEFWFMFNLAIVGIFVVVPFFYEITYSVSYITTWWDWLNRVFFLRILHIYIYIVTISNIIQMSNRWLNWKFKFLLSCVISLLLLYLFFFNFIILIFGYFTDSTIYKDTGWLKYSGLSLGPNKWGWGNLDRDLFNYHSTRTNFWFKNDSMYASFFLLVNLFMFISMIFLIIQWSVFKRNLYSNKFISYTFLTYINNNLRLFVTGIIFLFFFVLISYYYQLIRLPGDLYFFNNFDYFFKYFLLTITNYFYFLLSIFF